MVAEKDIATCTVADQARALMRDERRDEAVRLMRATLMERPGTAEEYSLLGMALAQSGETAAALHALDEAVVVDPSDAIAHFNRGQLYLQEGRRREALEAFEHALAVRPRYTAAAAAAAELRQQGVPSSRAQQWQPPKVYPLAGPPALRAGPTPRTDGATCGWDSILAEPVPVVEISSLARPPSLAALIIAIYAGATFSLVVGLYELVTRCLIDMGGPRAPGAADASATALILFVTAVSVAQLIIGNHLWYGFAWARPAMMGALAMRMFPPLLALCQAPNPYEIVSAIGRLLLPLVFIGVLHLPPIKRYCD